MAVILHIETAEEFCSVCIAKNGILVSFETENSKYSHASVLTLLIEKVVHQVGLKSLAEIDAVAVSMGPGSYTGLRIGTAVAKGICYALNKPLIAVPTLLAMADSFIESYNPNSDDLIIPCLDARRMEVYYTVLSSKLREVEITRAEVINELTFKNLNVASFKVYFLGSGAEKISTLYNCSNFCFYPNINPSASGMVKTAYMKFKGQKFENAAHFEPFYLKDFVSTVKT